ncbi:MAG: uracil-DNA glycosylase family protein [Pseudomonadales bacterium]|nr:uracil-DNA glycosylase family protein [Pseudomonadales bacterium]
MTRLSSLLNDVRNCTLCEKNLPLGARPILQLHQSAKILIAGQAPGKKVHESGIPFDDASGEHLREWLGISHDEFYNPELVAILPMGFCYPCSGKSGDLPPRPECAPAWRDQLLGHLTDLQLTIVLGAYAQKYHFGQAGSSVTELVKSWRIYWPEVIPLPHPSPRNNIWLSKNPWFEVELLPLIKQRVSGLLSR